jgi:hypothetical protein
MDEEVSPLARLPRPIAEGFFNLAEEEAKKTMQRILQVRKRIRKVKEYLKFEKIEREESKIRVLVIDGSKSREPDVRIGTRTILIAAAYMLFEGSKLVEQNGETYEITLSSYGRFQNSFASTVMHLMERDLALRKLKELSPDLLLIDGSFFGFRVNCQKIRGTSQRLFGKRIAGEDVIKELVKTTNEIIKSKKAVGIIKRSALSAIDGWILKNLGEAHVTNSTDKFILTLVMDKKAYWEYSSLNVDPEVYTRFASTYEYLKEEKGFSKQEIFEHAEKSVQKLYKNQLGFKREDLPKRERGFLRYYREAPPFEVEVPEGVSIKNVGQRLLNFINQASGLPFPIDMVDEYVALPLGTTSAFVQEVEARILGNKDVFPAEVSSYFSHLNPQKPQWV